jgi:signal transduction histidine kinase
MGSGWPVVIGTLCLMGLAAIGATIFALVQTQRLEGQVRRAVGDMLTSIRLVGELQNEIEKRRALVNIHIATTSRQGMAAIDSELGTVTSGIATRIQSFGPWSHLAGEAGGWERAQADLALLEEPVERALALSRRNHNEEARHLMEQAAPRFAAAQADLDRIIAANDRGATEGLATFSAIRRQLVVTLLGIALAVIAGTLMAGFWAMGQIRQRNEEMTLNAQKLEARNRELDAFAGRVAHDIRGSLTAITLATTPIAAKMPRDDRGIQILQRGTRRMQALVEDLLTLARVEATVHGQCDPVTVVAQVVEDLGARTEEGARNLRVSVQHAAVACSEGLLRLAVTNLVDNALKYRRPEVAADVEISGGISDGGYDLRVADNGRGMTKEDAGRACEPFYRSPQTQDLPGTGLGLSIVCRVAEASRGRLSVDSELGRGSTFVVHLPLSIGGDLGGVG